MFFCNISAYYYNILSKERETNIAFERAEKKNDKIILSGRELDCQRKKKASQHEKKITVKQSRQERLSLRATLSYTIDSNSSNRKFQMRQLRKVKKCKIRSS